LGSGSEIKLGNRELVSIILIASGAKLADTTPTLMINDAKTAIWLVPFVAGTIMYLFFYLAYKVVSKKQSKNLIEVSVDVFGPMIGNLFGFILFLFVIITLIVDLRGYVNNLATMHYPQTPLLVLLLFFLGGVLYNARRGIEAIGSVFYVSFFYIKVSILVLAILIIIYSRWQSMFPLLGGGFFPILKQGIEKASIFGDLFLVLVIYPFIQNKKSLLKVVTGTTVFLMMEIAFFYLIYIMLFGYPFMERITYPFHESAKYVKIGTFASHVETFFLFFWLVASLLRFSFYMYCSAIIFGTITKIKEFEPIIIPLSIITLIFSLYPENPADNTFFVRNIIFTTISLGLMGYSVLLWTTDKIKGRKNK